MTTPSTLAPVGTTALWHSYSAAYHGPFTYKFNASPSQTLSSDYAAYSLYYDSDGLIASDAHSIKVGITPGHTDHNVWSDLDGASIPEAPVENSDGTISLNDSSGNLLYKFTKPTSANASWLSGSVTGTEGVNSPYVTWNFPNRSCGETTYVSVTHTEATSSATTYTVHDDTSQIGTILVGTSSTATANFSFTISARTLHVKDPSGSIISTRVFTCGGKKVFCNFW